VALVSIGGKASDTLGGVENRLAATGGAHRAIVLDNFRCLLDMSLPIVQHCIEYQLSNETSI
jgi:hypothetical protein